MSWLDDLFSDKVKDKAEHGEPINPEADLFWRRIGRRALLIVVFVLGLIVGRIFP